MARKSQALITVQFKLKNAALLKAVRAAQQGESLLSFCRKRKLSYQTLLGYLGMKETPLRKSGEWKESALKLSAIVNVSPNVIWPEELQTQFKKTSGEFDVSPEEVQQLANPDKVRIESLRPLLTALRPRELQAVIDHTNGDTLEQMGEKLGVSRERARAIYNKALSKMKQRAAFNKIKFNDLIDTEYV